MSSAVAGPLVIASFDPPRFVVEAWSSRWNQWQKVGSSDDEVRALKTGRDWADKNDVKTQVLDRGLSE